MAVEITILGNQIKVEGARAFDGKAVYGNINDVTPEYNGTDVRISNKNGDGTLLPDTDFNDFDTPDGTALGSAEALVDAIAALLPAPSSPSGTSNVAVVDPTIAGAPTTVSVLVTTTQLLAANTNRTEALITNDGSAQIRLEIGSNATLTSAIILEAGESWVTSKTLVINAISTSGTQAASITEYTK